jgi:hypothetical protein
VAEQALRKEYGYCQLLVDDLKAYRHQITRAHLAGNFEVAFDLALYALCVDLFDRFRYHGTPLQWRATEATPGSSLNDLSRHPGRPADRGAAHALALDWLKLPAAEGFAALAAVPAEAKQRLFAWCIASCLEGAERDAEISLARAAEHKLPQYEAWGTASLGIAQLYQGEPRKAVHTIFSGCESALRTPPVSDTRY